MQAESERNRVRWYAGMTTRCHDGPPHMDVRNLRFRLLPAGFRREYRSRDDRQTDAGEGLGKEPEREVQRDLAVVEDEGLRAEGRATIDVMPKPPPARA